MEAGESEKSSISSPEARMQMQMSEPARKCGEPGMSSFHDETRGRIGEVCENSHYIGNGPGSQEEELNTEQGSGRAC